MVNIGHVEKLGTTIVKALERNATIALNGKPIMSPVFRIKPSVVEAIPENLLHGDVFSTLRRLDGKPIKDVETFLNETNTTSSTSFLESVKALLCKNKNLFSNSLSTSVSHETKARNKLAKIYEQIAKEASSSGNAKRGNIYSDFAKRVRNGEFTEEDVYSKLYNEIYNGLRKADYPITPKYNHKIANLTEMETHLIQVKNEGGWHYRLPKNRNSLGWSTSDKCIDRISVNAETDEKLITTLDNLFTSGKIKGYYKTPDQAASWLERHDPITIYLHEQATPTILNEVKQATSPYIRSDKNVLSGITFAPGLALEKSPQQAEILSLLNEAKLFNPQLEKSLRQNFTRKGELKASAGQMTSAKNLLQYLKV